MTYLTINVVIYWFTLLFIICIINIFNCEEERRILRGWGEGGELFSLYFCLRYNNGGLGIYIIFTQHVMNNKVILNPIVIVKLSMHDGWIIVYI